MKIFLLSFDSFTSILLASGQSGQSFRFPSTIKIGLIKFTMIEGKAIFDAYYVCFLSYVRKSERTRYYLLKLYVRSRP